jgi:GNAT superfamily N-acetyltransferase
VARSRGPSAAPHLTFRAWAGPGDFDVIADLANVSVDADGVGAAFTGESYAHYVQTAGAEPVDTVTIARADGVPVGFAIGHWQHDRDEGERALWVRIRVNPAWRDDTIGARMLAHAERSSLADAERRPPIALPWVFQTRLSETETWATSVFEAAGYRPIRWAHRMVRPTLDDPPSDELPRGIEARPVRREHAMQVLIACEEAMRDEPLVNPRSEAQLAAALDDPIEGQLDVWQVAWEGDEVVGGVLGYINAEENAGLGRRRGYTESIFTRRPWRGRGIASALIGRNLRLLKARGMTEAALIANANNSTGALGLYERLGFRRTQAEITYERPVPTAPSRSG